MNATKRARPSPSPASTPAPADLAARVGADLDRRLGRFARAVAQLRSRSDGTALHDARVSARRLAAILAMWRPLFRAHSRRKTVRRLRALRQALGPAREAEVHWTDLSARLAARAPEARAAAAELLAGLGADLERLRGRAARRATPGSQERMLRRLERARGVIPERAATRPEAAALAEARLERLARRAREAIAAARARRDDEALHAARLAIKRWRYAGESLSAAGLVPRGPGDAALRRAQERLGRAHDRATMRDLVVAGMARLRERGSESAADELRVVAFELEGERRRAVEQFAREAAGLLEPDPAPGD